MIISLCIFSFDDLVELLLQRFVFDTSKLGLVLEALLCLPDLMFVIEIVASDLCVEIFILLESQTELCHLLLVISLLQIELLSANRSILLVTADSVLEERLLLIEHLHQKLAIGAEAVQVLMW